MELNKAVFHGITLVRPSSYSQRSQRPYEDRVYCRTLEFHGLGRRAVVGEFDGGKIISYSGGLLLREVEQRSGILKRLAGESIRRAYHRPGDYARLWAPLCRHRGGDQFTDEPVQTDAEGGQVAERPSMVNGCRRPPWSG
jgi:hypothetical protein